MSDMSTNESVDPLTFGDIEVNDDLPAAEDLQVPEGLEPVSKLVRALESAQRDGREALLVSFCRVPDAQAAERAAEYFKSLLDSVRAEPAAPPMASLIDAMLPDEPPPVPSEATVLQARRNAHARLELLEEFGYVTAEQIAEGRSRADNRHALASSWRRGGRVFAVEYKGRKLFPGFQFDEQGLPRPVISAVLAALPTAQMSDWEVALWWTSANGWLDSERPVDRLDDRDALVAAAAHLAEPLPL
jgi:hypothetical protein